MKLGRARIVGAWWNRLGVTREVLLVGGFAVKLPKLTYGWKMFLCGLLANMQEREFASLRWPELCPVLFAVPGAGSSSCVEHANSLRRSGQLSMPNASATGPTER